MNNKTTDTGNILLFLLSAIFILSGSSCNTTKYLKPDQSLLRQNTVKIKKQIDRKGEIKDNLAHIEAQKPNSYFLGIPVKLLLYNRGRKKYQNDTANFQITSKTVERPVIFDTALLRRSVQDMHSYMNNQGYFYNRVTDTFVIKKQKAYVTYTIVPNDNYLINTVHYDADDTIIARVVKDGAAATGLQKGKDFTMSMLEDERSRVTTLLRDHGYYRFSQENVTFLLDTVNKALFRDEDSPFENAMDFVSSAKRKKDRTLDVNVIIRQTDDSAVYTQYHVNNITVYPDFVNNTDLRSKLFEKVVHGISFRYHSVYVKPNVLYEHIYMAPGKLYTQSDYDKTIIKLNELGIFKYIHIAFREDSIKNNLLNAVIELNRTKKHDYTTTYEISNGSTYSVGNSLSLTYRDRNIAKGANLFTATLNGGIELIYDDNYGKGFFNHFYLLTEYYGANFSIDFPKFLAPVAASLFNNNNLPHTIISAGTNLLDRVDYFTLINTTTSFSYSWRQSNKITWSLSPIFINIISLPYEADSFRIRLDSNAFLRDSYKQNFIEGENLTFTYSDLEAKRGKNYSYLRAGVEEAGALLAGINSFGGALNNLYDIKYAQYVKFDVDARHYFTFANSTFAFRFIAGLGIPYGQSQTLPYIKQYFVGGFYSLRGWRIRSLGPGSYYNAADANNINLIDRTGDIKLEWNGEYRFFIANLFAGGVKFNGALFTDAGNIWLARKDANYPGGEFNINTLGQDIASDIGVGTRFDVASFLTVRLDVAIPIKKPYVFTNGGFVFNQINFGDPTWRSNNIVFNFTIGYPF